MTFALSLITITQGQVKIKEKVEIKASVNSTIKGLNTTSTTAYTPCGPYYESNDPVNPYQVVWIGSTYPLDVTQQAFNYQANPTSYIVNGYYTVEITEGADKCELVEVFRCDSVTGECPDPISQNLGTKIENISHLDMEGEGDFTIWQGIPSRILAGYVRYQVRFIKPGNVTIRYTNEGSGEEIDYHTIIVQPDYYFEYNGMGELPHGEEDNDVDLREHTVQCQDEWTFWNGGGLPDYVKLNVSIIEGSEYGRLIHETFDDDLFVEIRDTSESFTNLDGTNELLLAAFGKEPEDTAIVKLRYTTTDNNIAAVEQEIKIVKNPTYPLRVTLIPEELIPGDTANITLERRIEGYPYSEPWNYTYEPFAPDQLFDISIEKGNELGTIFSITENDTSDEFKQVTDGFYFIAKDTIDAASAEVSIRVKTVLYYFYDESAAAKNSSKNKVNKNKNKVINSISIIGVPTNREEIFGIGKATIHKSAIEIMLGETKYFGVKKKGNEENYKIEEVETNYGEEPKYTDDTNEEWKWIKNNDVWGSEPIEKLGTKSGVYWEKKWFDKTDNRNKDLEAGLIRLIGRFWEEGKEDSFKIKLKSTQNTEIEIKVIKPAKLLSDGQSPTYARARDVHNKEYSIDSLCFYYGGKYGVPPQMIKGQMLQESSKKDFGGSTGWGFAPSYRYEPYTTQFYGVVKDILKLDTNPFIVTLEPNKSMGKPGASSVPTKLEHQHLEFSNNFGNFFHYIEDAKSVWDVIKEKSKIVNINNIYSTYGFQYEGTDADTLKKGQIKSGVYSIVDNTYLDFLKGKKIEGDKDGKREGGYEKIIKEKYKIFEGKLSGQQQTEANDSARAALIRLFINKYDKIPAQTRIAASYGLLQTTYPTVYKDHKYPTRNTDKPENLNEVDTNMVYSMKHYEKLFKYNGFPLDEKNSNWVSSKNEVKNSDGIILFEKPSAGYEEALKVMYYLWNSGLKNKAGTKAIYHTEVLDKSELFLPRRK